MGGSAARGNGSREMLTTSGELEGSMASAPAKQSRAPWRRVISDARPWITDTMEDVVAAIYSLRLGESTVRKWLRWLTTPIYFVVYTMLVTCGCRVGS